MTALLAIETATDVCSVAIFHGGRVVVELGVDRPRLHAERLVPMIGEAMTVAGLVPTDLAAVAVSAGPGSYTGLRIGASTAKGLAFALSIPLVAVPSLQALASSVPSAPGSIVMPAFAARRGEVYAAAFRIGRGGMPEEVLSPTAGDGHAVLDAFVRAGPPSGGPVLLVGNGAPVLAAAARGRGLACTIRETSLPGAAAVARLGIALLAAGASVDAATFEPYYLREFTARTLSQHGLVS